MLGPLDARVDGASVVVDTRKALAILTLLAVERRPYARDELAAMFWPESDEESARGALRRTLSVLRAGLGERWLRVDRTVIALDMAGVQLDLATLEGAQGSSDRTLLSHAAEAARGPFLAGFSLRDSPDFDDWRATQGAAVERMVATVLDRLSAAAELAGDLVGAVAAAARRVDLDALDESAQRRLMTLLVRSGDRAGAIRQYRTSVAILERELGVSPLAATTDLYESIRDSRLDPVLAQVAAAPVPVARRLPLVGRDAELAALLRTHADSTPSGRLVLVTGEAGIGKTRLGEALADIVEGNGGTTLLARAWSAETAIPYGPIVELLRAGIGRPDASDRLARLPPRALVDLERLVTLPPMLAVRAPVGSTAADPGGPQVVATEDRSAARVRMLDAVAEALSALVGGPIPGVIIVEDVQWADDATREALTWLARRLNDRSLILVLSWRPEDLDDRGLAFAARLEEVAAIDPLRLQRLDRSAVTAMVEAVPTANRAAIEVDVVVEESEGIPLYVVEALAAASGRSSDGPHHGVRALLRERLATVGEMASQVLAAAAVIGRSFDLATVRAASGRTEDETVAALEELVRRGIVRELGDGGSLAFDFAHAKLRDTAYEGTSLARRRLLHRRTAELLRSMPGAAQDRGRLAQIARHERSAGRDADAAEAFREAGVRSRSVYANREALEHFETALALGHPDIVGLQLTIGELRTMVGDYAGASAMLEAAAAVASERDLPAIEMSLGLIHVRRGDLDSAASHLDAAIESLEDRDGAERAMLARVLVERGLVALRARDLERARGCAGDALVMAEEAKDPAAVGAAHRLLGLVARERGDLVVARAELERSVALASGDPDGATAIAAGNSLALVEAAAGDRAAAIDRLERALGACQRTGLRHLEAAVENNLADQLHAVGRVEDAMDHLKRAVVIFADVGGTPGELEPELWKLVEW